MAAKVEELVERQPPDALPVRRLFMSCGYWAPKSEHRYCVGQIVKDKQTIALCNCPCHKRESENG